MHSIASKEKPGIPLPAVVAAVWGGFLYEGLLTTGPNPRRTQDVLEVWGQGCIELVVATSIFLPEVWRQICELWESSDMDFPGVFEYEVVSPLGTYLGDYLLTHGGHLPTHETVKEKIRELISAFLRAGEGGAQPLPAIASWPPCA